MSQELRVLYPQYTARVAGNFYQIQLILQFLVTEVAPWGKPSVRFSRPCSSKAHLEDFIEELHAANRTRHIVGNSCHGRVSSCLALIVQILFRLAHLLLHIP